MVASQLIPRGVQMFRAYEPNMDTKKTFLGYGFVPFQPARDVKNIVL